MTSLRRPRRSSPSPIRSFPTTDSPTQKGLPDYTFKSAPGELWRSRFDAEHNVIVINNGHRDFVYAARNKSLKLRYICRLFAKELVLPQLPRPDGRRAPGANDRAVALHGRALAVRNARCRG